jgi:hypothetical protein
VEALRLARVVPLNRAVQGPARPPAKTPA